MKTRTAKIWTLVLGTSLGISTVSPLLVAQSSSSTALQIGLYPGVSIIGAVGTVHSVEYTVHLAPPNWSFLTLVQLTNNPHLHVDITAGTREQRFYRTTKVEPASFEELQLLPQREGLFFRAAMGLPELVTILPGNFLLGSPTSETGRSSDEGPQTLVTLTRSFYMGKYEVTQSEYAIVNGVNASAFQNNANLPVEMVSWQNAAAHGQKLTQREAAAGRLPTGWIYRMPTEAEWEYSCRAGKTTRYSFGDDASATGLVQYAWFGDVVFGRTHPVGTKLPNPWGLHDMHGNVWELCQDALTYTGGSVTNPVGTGSGRTSRGGSWHSLAARCRSATRNLYPDLTAREPWVGFRLVLAPASP